MGVHAIGIVEELAEFQPVVTHDARIGSTSVYVLVDEIVDDLTKFGSEINGIKRDIQLIGDAPSVVCVAGTATTLLVAQDSICCGERRDRG